MGKKKRDPYNFVSYENIVQNQELIFREHFLDQRVNMKSEENSVDIVWIMRRLQQKLATKKLKLRKNLPTSLMTVEDLMMLITLKGENAIKK